MNECPKVSRSKFLPLRTSPSSGGVCISCSDSATLWTILRHYGLYSLLGSFVHGILRQEYWSRLLFPFPKIFLTQGLNPGLLHCRQILYHLSHKGSHQWRRRTFKQINHSTGCCILPHRGLSSWLSGKEPTCQCRRHRRLQFDPGWEDPLVEDMATHSSIPVCKIP